MQLNSTLNANDGLIITATYSMFLHYSWDEVTRLKFLLLFITGCPGLSASRLSELKLMT